jgi:hypothetical protein
VALTEIAAPTLLITGDEAKVGTRYRRGDVKRFAYL